METNFQTSFVPKKPVVAEPREKGKPLGFLTLVSILIFFTMLIATGVLYFYKGTLSTDIAKMKNDLTLAEGRFEPAKLAQLNSLDKRLKAATQVLNNHIAISPIFQELEKVTLKSVRFSNFSYSESGTKTSSVNVKLSGVAADYASVALESDAFSQDKNFVDPVFSNLTLNDKGNVTFDLEFSLNPNFVNYEKSLEATAQSGN